MNTSLQLYNASFSPNMCPLWPEMPLLDKQQPLLFPTDSSKLDDINTLQTENQAAISAFANVIDYGAAPALGVFRSYYFLLPCLQGDVLSCANYYVWGTSQRLMKLFPEGQQATFDKKINTAALALFSDLIRIHALKTAAECFFGNWPLCITYVGTLICMQMAHTQQPQQP